MVKEVALLTLHGMGKFDEKYANKLRNEVLGSLGTSDWEKVYFKAVRFSDILQDNQERVMDAMKKGDLDWIRLRQFLLYGFSDAAGSQAQS